MWLKLICRAAIVWAVCTAPCPAEEPKNPPDTAPLMVLRFAAIFDVLPGMNIEDARLTVQTLVQKTMSRKSHPYRPQLDIISDYTKAAETLASGGYEFAVLTSMDYMELNHKIPLRPIIIMSRLDQPTESLLLITRKGLSLDGLDRDAKLIIEEGRTGVMSRIWLDTILLESGFAASQNYFSDIRYARKPSRILLPVFFGKADVCIITRSAFDLLSELNPQIANNVSVQRQSEGLVFWVVCATEIAEPATVDIVANETNWLNKEDAQQALTFIQMKRFVSYKKEFFQATLDLYARYRRLTTSRREVTITQKRPGS